MQWSDVTKPPSDEDASAVCRALSRRLWQPRRVALVPAATRNLDTGARRVRRRRRRDRIARSEAVKPIFVGWMIAAFPIGWVVSRVALGAIYFRRDHSARPGVSDERPGRAASSAPAARHLLAAEAAGWRRPRVFPSVLSRRCAFMSPASLRPVSGIGAKLAVAAWRLVVGLGLVRGRRSTRVRGSAVSGARAANPLSVRPRARVPPRAQSEGLAGRWAGHDQRARPARRPLPPTPKPADEIPGARHRRLDDVRMGRRRRRDVRGSARGICCATGFRDAG